MGRCRVAFLGHFIGFIAGAILAPLAQLFGTLLDTVESVEGGVLGDGLNVVEAGESGACRINGDFGDKEGAIKNIGVLADGSDGAEIDGVFSPGEAAFPAALFVLVVVDSLEGLVVLFFLFAIGLLLFGGGSLSAGSRRLGGCGKDGQGQGEEEDCRFHSGGNIVGRRVKVKVRISRLLRVEKGIRFATLAAWQNIGRMWRP